MPNYYPHMSDFKSDKYKDDDNNEVILVKSLEKELNSICAYWEIRNKGIAVFWALKLLEDFTAMHAKDWKFIIAKIKYDDKDAPEMIENYSSTIIDLGKLRPTDGENPSFNRLPIELIEKNLFNPNIKSKIKPKIKKKKKVD